MRSDTSPGPLFSIITVVLNDRKGLGRTRSSLRRQSCRNFAWIVVDGGSEDGTRDDIARFAPEIAWWRSGPDRGLYDAMNIGMAAATGDYLLFLNAGDELASPDSLERLAAVIRAHASPDFLYCDALERTPRGTLLRKPARSHRTVWYGMFTHHQAMIYRRSAVADLSYDLSFKVGADYAFTISTLSRSARVARLREALIIFAPGGLSQAMASVGRRDQTRIRRQYLRLSAISCFLIMVVQSLAMLTRRGFPAFYEICRCRRMYE
ncbi:glycosyltransferase family 2 protein [Skermanella pratensis]|uniref:glycosyltransferase family 2 protein n=1 Tax=Skermanella pratensis TaxID=2233999 RepID=UPI0013013D87|nr:glycosyltransferase family 2 protein [Skermanella pratensis]